MGDVVELRDIDENLFKVGFISLFSQYWDEANNLRCFGGALVLAYLYANN